MKPKPITPTAAISATMTIKAADLMRFTVQFRELQQAIDAEAIEKSGEQAMTRFLENTYYPKRVGVSKFAKTDLNILLPKGKRKTVTGVMLEVKRVGNTAEMVDINNLNTKALHELILYYCQERAAGNTEIKYLIATNGNEWFIFDAVDIEKLFYKPLKKKYEQWANGQLVGKTTDFFYKEIVQPHYDHSDNSTATLPFIHFDIQKITTPTEIKHLAKLFDPRFLLKKGYEDDSNTLNQGFYRELLHLIGLEEHAIKSKKIIRRKPEGKRDYGSLLENTIDVLQSSRRYRQVSDLSAYGKTKADQIEHLALELCITWVNRLLFLKLLEAQLIRYHGGNLRYQFLNITTLPDYDEVYKLFFRVLAVRPNDRRPDIRTKYTHIPYLNSSLFEPTRLEEQTISINNLDGNLTLPLYAKSVLKKDRSTASQAAPNPLAYLFRFLDAYDFAAESTNDVVSDTKEIINAAVLGLIFEKINGYKDGSFFTPGFITMYMCRETLHRAVVQKFNEAYGWDAERLLDLVRPLDRLLSRGGQAAFKEVNAHFNSLRICDPAVGSGHFLVSALNELIALKSELGILADKNWNYLSGFHISVENDRLLVREYGKMVTYQVNEHNETSHPRYQILQETLFEEKRTLIENCLFGVDINPNSVKICRLRLWIELLKNAYYTKKSNYQELETLPNIDINIKVGNSLVSKFYLDDAQNHFDTARRQWIKRILPDYKIQVDLYKSVKDKEAKEVIQRKIDAYLAGFEKIYNPNDRDYQAWKKKENEWATESFSAFPNPKVIAKLQKEMEQLKANYLKKSAIYRNAFEWRYRFPEVLNEQGEFVGFDVVLGNPPYIRQEEFKQEKPYLKQRYQTFRGTADLLVYFIEKGLNLLKPNAQFTYIISNKFMRASFGKALRKWLAQYNITEIIDFGDLPVFEEATTYPCILSLQKTPPTETFLATDLKTLTPDQKTTFHTYIRQQQFESLQASLTVDGWNLANKATQQLLEKLKRIGTPLGEYLNGKIYRGILTGYNKAFVIDAATKKELITKDPKSAAVIKPFLAGRDIKRYQVPVASNFLILFPKGWTHQHIGHLSEKEAFGKLQNLYPTLANYLVQYEAAAKKRYDKGDYWWELRACDYYDAFEKPKILFPDISLRGNFTLDKTGQFYLGNTGYIISSDDLGLLGILCSNLIHFFYKNLSSSYRGGYLRFIRQYVEQIPILQDEKVWEDIKTKVTQILAQKQADPKADTSALEREIDQLVYGLYGLTAAEIAVVEGKNK